MRFLNLLELIHRQTWQEPKPDLIYNGISLFWRPQGHKRLAEKQKQSPALELCPLRGNHPAQQPDPIQEPRDTLTRLSAAGWWRQPQGLHYWVTCLSGAGTNTEAWISLSNPAVQRHRFTTLVPCSIAPKSLQSPARVAQVFWNSSQLCSQFANPNGELGGVNLGIPQMDSAKPMGRCNEIKSASIDQIILLRRVGIMCYSPNVPLINVFYINNEAKVWV